MEKSDLGPASLGNKAEAAGDRGAGGKVRKPPSRRPSATPYARPLQNLAQRSSPWLSRLVDPASRLIWGGANLIFPSFFSKQQSTNDSVAKGVGSEEGGEGDHQFQKVDVEPSTGGSDDGNLAFNWQAVSRPIEVASISKVEDGLKSDSEFYGHQHRQKVGTSGRYELSEIEQLMKYRSFSRDEIIHLTEILNSRAVDLPNIRQEEKHSSMTADVRGLDTRSDHALEYSGKTTKEMKEYPSGSLLGTSKIPDKKHIDMIERDVGGHMVSFERSRKSTDKKFEDLNASIVGTSASLLQSTLQDDVDSSPQLEDDVGSSPIKIAKAYMRNRTSQAGSGSMGSILTDQETLLQRNELVQKAPVQSPFSKTPTYWPGAITQDRGYMTPESQRERFGFNNFPRSPYSRTDLKSKVTTKGSILQDSHGSVGPTRRLRHRVAQATPRGSTHFHSSLRSSEVENINVSEGFLSTSKNFENEGRSGSSKFPSVDSKPQNSNVSVPIVPSHSRQMACKILEHLERNPAAPKDKSAELELATKGKKDQFSNISSFRPKKHIGLPYLGAFDSFSKSNQDGRNSSCLREARENSLFKFPSTKVANDAAKFSTSSSDLKVDHSYIPVSGSDVGPSKDFEKSLDSQVMTTHEDARTVVPEVTGSEVPILQKKLQSQSSANKPVLPYISIGKPGQSWRFSSDKSSGFTFPVPASSGVLSEPPTPSIMPLSSESGLYQSNDVSSIPSYSFGTKRSTPAFDFSFPSESSASTVHDDVSDLKFNFGSDKTNTISFSSIGKNAICY